MPTDGRDSGPASGRGASASRAPSSGRRVAAPDANGFDALNAALGRTPSSGVEHADSHGRSAARYASSRPHAVAPAHISPEADPSMPAVIVAVDDTVPSAPPRNMTTPIGAVPHTIPLGLGHLRPPPTPAPPTPVPATAVLPHTPPAPPSQQSYPFTPPPFPVQARPHHPTVRMADAPRRPRAHTVVTRVRGPSTAQKVGAFLAMLVLVTACGVAVIVWRKPAWLGLAPPEAPPAPVVTAAASPTSAAAPGATTPVLTPAQLPTQPTPANALPNAKRGAPATPSASPKAH